VRHVPGGVWEILPCRHMVDLQSETIDRRRGGASDVSVGRFGKSRQAICRKGGDFIRRGVGDSGLAEKQHIV
jgi:hypothetical protein